jgi:hypothetical protein
VVLSIDPVALERCFQAIGVLDELFGQPALEFGMLGLATRARPLQVVATPLLLDQEVSAIEVYQRGHSVIAMRAEIAALAARLSEPVIPITFIHRHPGECFASETDREFLRRVFINHVAPLVAFRGGRTRPRGAEWCVCEPQGRGRTRRGRNHPACVRRPVEYSYAFSLIINEERARRLYAVRQDTCLVCSIQRLSEVPAELTIAPDRRLSAAERHCIRTQLRDEIVAKIRPVAGPPVGRVSG